MEYHIDLKGLGQVMRNPDYTDKEKVLLQIVSDHCQYCLNTGRPCELSYSMIRKWTGWGDHTIQNTIASLVDKGDITYTTQQLEGNRKSTAIVDSRYCHSSSTNTVETAVLDTVETAVNNNTKKTTNNNSTIAEGTYSHKCESDFGDSDLGHGEETTFLNGEGDGVVDIKAILGSNVCNEKVMGDLLEWTINRGWFVTDVQVKRVVEQTQAECGMMKFNEDQYTDMFNAMQKKADSERLTKIIHT